MRILKHLFIILIVYSCKEKTFADDIVLNFPKNEKLTFQKFNEGIDDAGSDFIYFGNADSIINIRYHFKNIPETIPNFKEEKEKKKSSENESLYFRTNNIPVLFMKDLFLDSLDKKNLDIIVKQYDTILLYKKDFDTRKIKKQKAFPIFIKNISNKTLKIPLEFNDVLLYVQSKENFQLIRNNNFYIDGYGLDKHPYFELKPDEILIYAFPHLKKGATRKAKFIFYNSESEEFPISVDEKIISNQSQQRFLK